MTGIRTITLTVADAKEFAQREDIAIKDIARVNQYLYKITYTRIAK